MRNQELIAVICLLIIGLMCGINISYVWVFEFGFSAVTSLRSYANRSFCVDYRQFDVRQKRQLTCISCLVQHSCDSELVPTVSKLLVYKKPTDEMKTFRIRYS